MLRLILGNEVVIDLVDPVRVDVFDPYGVEYNPRHPFRQVAAPKRRDPREHFTRLADKHNLAAQGQDKNPAG